MATKTRGSESVGALAGRASRRGEAKLGFHPLDEILACNFIRCGRCVGCVSNCGCHLVAWDRGRFGGGEDIF